MADNTIAKAYVQIIPSAEGISVSLSNVLDGEATKAGTSAGGKMAGAMGTAAKVGVAAIGVATTAVAGFGKASVDAGMSFDSSMSQVAATMGFSTSELNTAGSEASKTFEQLSEFAQEMGASTAFSASEAADALNYMALAGYDANTSMKMLPTVLNLAAAGGIELAQASDMVTDAQSALGLSLEDTYIMVDEMAAASSKSNTSVAQLGEAFLTIGANAKSLSGGTTELATALGLLADNGIKGAEGGTHLRNIMLALNPTTDKAMQAWDKLGVSAYDAEGNLRPLEDTFADLNKAMAGMTDEEKSRTLTKMFNKTDLAAVNALLSTSSDRWKELGDAIYYSDGAASTMADVQLDNLEGDITLFESALEGAEIAISDGLTPSIREFVQFGGNALQELTKSFKEGGLEGAMSQLGTIITDLSAKLIEKVPMLIEAGMQLLSALVQGVIDNLPLLLQTATQVILQLATGIAQALPELIPTIVNVVLTIVEYLVDNIDLLIDAAIQLTIGLAEGLMQALPILVEKAPLIIAKLALGLIKEVPKIVEAAIKLVITFANGLVQFWSKVIEVVPELMDKVKAKFMYFVTHFKEIGSNIVSGIWEGIKGAWGNLIENVGSLAKDLLGSVESFFKIGSPSKLFRDEIGRWLPAGIAVGIDDSAYMVDDAMLRMEKSTIDIGNDIASNTYSGELNTTNTTNQNALYDLLQKYLPEIAEGENLKVSLQGDANGLFKAVRQQNRQFMKQTGKSAFA